MVSKEFLEIIGIGFSIVLGLIVIVRTIVAITKNLVTSSTKFESSIISLSQAVDKLTNVMEAGMKELHARVDDNDKHIAELSINVAIIMRELNITPNRSS